MAAWPGRLAPHLWQGEASEGPQRTARGPLLWEGVWGCFQSSQEWGRIAEVCSSSVGVLVPGCRQAAGQRCPMSGH